MNETNELKLAWLLNVIQWAETQEELDQYSAEIRQLIREIATSHENDDSWEDDSWQ